MRSTWIEASNPRILRRAILAITSSNSHAISLPSAPIPGNVILVVMTLSAASSTINSEPTGYTRLFTPLQRGATNFTIAAWWRKAQSGDSATVTVGHSSTVNASMGIYEIEKVADPGLVAPDIATTDGGASTVTTLTVGVSPTSHAGLAFAFVMTNGNAGTFGNVWDGGFKQGYPAGGPNRLTESRRLSYTSSETLSTHETWTSTSLALGFCVNFATT